MKKRRRARGKPGDLALHDHAWGQFERSLKMMADYIAQNGHSYPIALPPTYDRHLNEFASRMRRTYARGRLDVDRETYLRRIGFNFTVDQGFNPWYRKYLKFKSYWEKRPASKTGKMFEAEMPHQLRRWITLYRWKRKQGKLSQQRIALLEQLNIDWEPFTTTWEQNYDALVKYLKRAKSPERPPLDTPEGLWLDNQISKITDGRLNAERTERIRALGIVVNPILSKREAVVQAVVEFKKRHGHARVPMKSRNPERDALMKWVRRQYRSGDLATVVRKKLNALKFAWNPPDHDVVVKAIRDNQHLPRSQKVWERRIRELRAFVRTHKHLPRYVDDPIEFTLYTWIVRVKKIVADPNDSMHAFYTRERRRMLRDLGVTFSKKRSRTS